MGEQNADFATKALSQKEIQFHVLVPWRHRGGEVFKTAICRPSLILNDIDYFY